MCSGAFDSGGRATAILLLAAVACTHTGTSAVSVESVGEPIFARGGDAAAARPREGLETEGRSLRACRPPLEGPARAIAIGSSTMGSAIGPMLRRLLAPSDIAVTVKAKSSSSLVRPDFFNWPAEIPVLLRRHEPQLVVVSLGVNDNQTLVPRRGKGVEPSDPRWDGLFAERVDEILNLAAGPERRPIVWVGPYAFRGVGSRVIGSRINRILAERIAAFPGPAFYVDAYAATLDSRGKPITDWWRPGKGKPVTARGRDGIHLKQYVVMELLVKPAAAIVRACLGGPQTR